MINNIIFIIGTTASGKTKLSLSLNNQHEIIGCDSMQLYKQADIMTAKATKQERDVIPHHCIDILDLQTQGFNRNDYVTLAKKTLLDIQQRGHIPIIVGGTTYYMEPLLFKLEQQSNENEQCEALVDHEDPYSLLIQMDPIAAQKFHPNDHRRIKNALKYHNRTGRLPSEIPDFHSGCELAVQDFIILWPKWKNNEDLRKRIAERVRKMVWEEGGLQEILNVYGQLYNMENSNGGVLQSIGYRQFKRVYEMSKEEHQEVEFKQVVNECIEQLIRDTIQYTKKQLQWIRNRILSNQQLAQHLFIFEFDSIDTFNEQVIIPAQSIINGESLTQYQLSTQEIQKGIQIREQKNRDNWKKEKCLVCCREMNGPIEYQQHYKSREHRIKLKQFNKKNKKNLN